MRAQARPTQGDWHGSGQHEDCVQSDSSEALSKGLQ
jgi:hypothetical protein